MGSASSAATASGTSSSAPRSAPSARAICATRRTAQRWLEVNAELRSGSHVSMSAPGAPIDEICTVTAPAACARVSASLV